MVFSSWEAKRRGNLIRVQINNEEFRWDGSDNGRRAMAAGSTVSSNLEKSYMQCWTLFLLFLLFYILFLLFLFILYFVSIIFIILYFYYFYILLFFYHLVNSWSIKINLKKKEIYCRNDEQKGTKKVSFKFYRKD